MSALARSGARGKLLKPEGEFGVFAEELLRISAQVYLQSAATSMHAERRILVFETAPILSPDKRVATIRLRDLALRRAMSAEDSGEVLDEAERPDVRFADVIGADDAKEELEFFVQYLHSPKKFLAQGLRPPKGVLIYGPPGTGKTLLARAMAGESNVAFLSVAASAFTTKYQGSGPESVRELFRRARRYAPSIVFIDEIDAIGRTRGSGNTGHGEEMRSPLCLRRWTVSPWIRAGRCSFWRRPISALTMSTGAQVQLIRLLCAGSTARFWLICQRATTGKPIWNGCWASGRAALSHRN